MLEALESIVDFFTSIVTFVIDFFQDLVFVIGTLGSVIVNIPSYIGWLPTSMIILITTAFSFVVIYKLLGREG